MHMHMAKIINARKLVYISHIYGIWYLCVFGIRSLPVLGLPLATGDQASDNMATFNSNVSKFRAQARDNTARTGSGKPRHDTNACACDALGSDLEVIGSVGAFSGDRLGLVCSLWRFSPWLPP